METQDFRNRDELLIFVERLRHFMNLWTVYNDLSTNYYIPSVGSDVQNEPQYGAYFHPTITIMLVLYAYFYSLIEDSADGINGFRVWREEFPEEEAAISAVEAQIKPFIDDLRVDRNRLGFHGSRTRTHEARGFDLFANTTGTAAWNAMKNFKALAAVLLAKDIAQRASEYDKLRKYRGWIDAIADRARRETECSPQKQLRFENQHNTGNRQRC